MLKSRIFLLFLLAFIAGVALRSFVTIPFFFIWLVMATGAVRAVLGIFQKRREVVVYSFLLIILAGGVLRFQQVESAPPNLSPLYGRELQAHGMVVEEPEVTPKVQRFTLRVKEVEGEFLDESFLTLVTLGRYPRYRLGDELVIRGEFNEPENFTDDFDYRAYLTKDDIFSTFFFPQVDKIGENKGNGLSLILSRIKGAFEEKIDTALPEPHAAFLKGLTLGERESLPEELIENFKRTGVTHIIALSGYNITLIADFFVLTLLALTVPFRFAFWIAAAGITLFVLLTGASPSVVRAGIMGILVLVAQKEGRLYSIRNALALAGAVMVFQNPKILRFDAAFQLSFLATLGLIYLSPRIEERFDRLRSKIALLRGQAIFKNSGANPQERGIFPIKRILVETLSAQIMVLPLLIFLFGRVSLVSPLSNLLVILAVPYSMGLGFATGALGLIWDPLAKIPGFMSWMFLEYKIQVVELFARVPYASVELGRWIPLPLIFIYGWWGYKLWRNSEKTAK